MIVTIKIPCSGLIKESDVITETNSREFKVGDSMPIFCHDESKVIGKVVAKRKTIGAPGNRSYEEFDIEIFPEYEKEVRSWLGT